MGNERDMVISFLLQACDTKARLIEDLQGQVTNLTKQLEDLKPKQETA